MDRLANDVEEGDGEASKEVRLDLDGTFQKISSTTCCLLAGWVRVDQGFEVQVSACVIILLESVCKHGSYHWNRDMLLKQKAESPYGALCSCWVRSKETQGLQ